MDTASRQDAVTRAQGWALALASVASFMVVLDLQVVATALTTIRRELGASTGQLEWTVNAYSLAFAVLLMTAAAVGDRFGRRRVFTAGLGVFAAGSAACALAPGPAALIAARAVQGVGAAMVMPLALALLNAAVPAQRRGWAMGIFGSVTALAVVVGPVLGGAITQAIGWPWIFWLNVPIGLLTILLALRHLDESYGPRAALDLPGVALGTAAALGLVWGLVRGSSVGWASPGAAGALAAGAVLAVAFTGWELRARAPMLPMRLFAIRGFSAGNAAAFLMTASITGTVFFMAQFQQVGLGQDPLRTGLRLLPWGVAPLLIAPRAGKLADRIGERPLVVSGLLLQAAGFGWIAVIAAPGLAYPAMLAPMMISGAGLGLAVPAVTKAVVGSVPRGDIGKASGGFSMMRQLGGAFGVAILAAVFATAGGYTSAAAFSNGFAPAVAAAAGLALAGALAGLGLPPRPGPARDAPGGRVAAGRRPKYVS
ncbi:MAG: DHA2 family efflux MFS transporter permease subunit [Streptosporangiaceae bacterium]